MADNEDGTTLDGEQAPEPTAPVTAPDAGEVTKLLSRNAGLDAKVSSLQSELKAEKEKRTAAEARALSLADEKENGDAELRAELERQRTENAEVKRQAALTRIESKYPETFGVLGEAASGLTEDQLAASEARMAGVAAIETPNPTPGGNNAPRTPPATPSMDTGDDIEKILKGMPVPW